MVAGGAVREEDRGDLFIESDLLRKASGFGLIERGVMRRKKHKKTKSTNKKRRSPVCVFCSFATFVTPLTAPKTRND
jgi:hypothetical protein